MELPGGGAICALAEVEGGDRDLLVLEQTLVDGRRFRWLCSRTSASPSGPLLAETVVPLLPPTSERSTRSGVTAARFGRVLLLPEYHRAMVAALGLATATPLHSLLFLGVGGGALPMFLAQHHPRCVLTGVECDRRVLRLAREHFGCKPGPRLRLHASSAEDFLRRLPSSRDPRRDPRHRRPRGGLHDAILVDASSHGGAPDTHCSPPPGLSTRRALRGLRARLRLGGALIVNVLGSAEHVGHVQQRLVGASGSHDTLRRIATAEGNVVLVAVRGRRVVARRAGRSPTSVVADSHLQATADGTEETASGDDSTWRAACAAVGLRVRAISRSHCQK